MRAPPPQWRLTHRRRAFGGVSGQHPMRKFTLAAIMAATAVLGGGAVAFAQSAARVYNGPVWELSYIETEPGRFDDYAAYLNQGWRASLEEAKKTGDVLDYKVLAVANPRDDEPDVMLLIKYKNMAVFDRS